MSVYRIDQQLAREAALHALGMAHPATYLERVLRNMEPENRVYAVAAVLNHLGQFNAAPPAPVPLAGGGVFPSHPQAVAHEAAADLARKRAGVAALLNRMGYGVGRPPAAQPPPAAHHSPAPHHEALRAVRRALEHHPTAASGKPLY